MTTPNTGDITEKLGLSDSGMSSCIATFFKYETKLCNYHMIQQFHSSHLSQGIKTYVYTKTWSKMFIVTLFSVAKKWKQSRSPTMETGMDTLSTGRFQT